MPAVEPSVPFVAAGLHGEAVASLADPDLAFGVARVVDPASAVETIHWGRNYLYAANLETSGGAVEVVVKQFRNQGLRRSLERRLRGSKAERSWRVARALLAAGIRTPEPLLLVESDEREGPSYFVTRRLQGSFEVRHFFRRLNGDPNAGEFPEAEPERLLGLLGRLARRLHDGGVFYRDLSIGNVLATRKSDGDLDLWLVDPNRARLGVRMGLVRRCRDLCRFPILSRAHRDAFLAAYWGSVPGRWSPRRWLHIAMVRAFMAKHDLKRPLRRRPPPAGGRHHAHIPPAPNGASARDKAVWDRLSDQPHQHARPVEKALIRLADAGSHLRDTGVMLAAGPRVVRRYRALRDGLHLEPVRFAGAGVALGPWEGDPEPLLEALEELGARSVMLRVHPWDEDCRGAVEMARELDRRGLEVAFALPQNRELVRDTGRWCAAVESLGEQLAPYGSVFQVGQAPNRSKWGVWTRDEYVRLYTTAAEVLRRRPGVELAGPAVIDFEYHFTAALVNRRVPGLHFDVVSSLLYVDRRGAPEATQLGFDTVGKVLLLKAIADTGRCSTGRCWITEVNWPLWEGPHAPAGRKVAVDEERHADYLVRYYLLVLGTGMVEKVFWWQLSARGYGLLCPEEGGGLRRRPAFLALRTLLRELEGAMFLGPVPSPAETWLYRFSRPGGEVVVGWSLDEGRRATLPRPATEVVDRDGVKSPAMGTTAIVLGPSPRYFVLSEG